MIPFALAGLGEALWVGGLPASVVESLVIALDPSSAVTSLASAVEGLPGQVGASVSGVFDGLQPDRSLIPSRGLAPYA